MNRLRLAVIGILALLGQHATAQTTVNQWGVSATTAYADCSGAVYLIFQSCNATNLGFWAPTVSTQSGGLNETFAEKINVTEEHVAGFDVLNMGTTSARVQLDNANLSLPVLKAKALSNDDNGWVSALAFGIQGYQYTGVAPTSISLSGALTGVITNPPNAILDPLTPSDITGFSMGVWLLSPSDPFAFPSSAATLGQFVNDVLTSTTDLDWWMPGDVTADGVVNQPFTLNSIRPIQPDEKFYLMAGLVASATGPGRSADAFGTLEMSFDDPTGLVPAGVAPVPEPETYAMMLVGLGLVGGAVARARKRKQALH